MNKGRNLYIVLVGIFLTNALLAELIGVKIFSLENSIGVNPVGFNILGYSLSFNLTAGVIIWPVVFLATDVINEYFGRKGVQRVSYLTVGCIAYAFFMIFIVTKLTPADFWLDVNRADDAGNPFDINYAFNKVYIQGLGIIVGSMIAFLIGQLVDVLVFQALKRRTGSEKYVWLRATGSTLVSQLIDSFVVLWIAFYALAPENGQWPLSQVFSVGTMNYIYKLAVAILLTPFIYLAHFAIDKFLGKQLASQMKEEAMK